MLPPVQTVSSTSIAFQDHRPDILPAKGTDVQVQAANQVVRSGQDLNPAIAARLNILMLSGHEQMAGNVAFLADMVGQAIGVVRKGGETNGAFAQRFVEALAKLTPQERIALERLLSQTMTGIKLRMLTDAFRNPAGPEAAKLAVYLEIARHKERDLATRTVVTSYRQNGGEPKSVVPGQQMQPASPMPPAAGRSEQPRLPADPASLVEVHGDAAPASADEMPADDGTADVTSNTAKREAEHAAGASDAGSDIAAGADSSRRMPAVTVEPVSGRDVTTAEPASADGSPALVNDSNVEVAAADQFDAASHDNGEPAPLEKGARALQERLRQTFEAGARTAAPEQSRVAPDGVASATRGAALSPSAPDAHLPDSAASARQAEASPNHATQRSTSGTPAERTDRAPRSSEPVQTMFVLKGWKEVISSTAAAIEAALSDHAAARAEALETRVDPQRSTSPANPDVAADMPSADMPADMATRPADHAPAPSTTEADTEEEARATADEAADAQGPVASTSSRDEELAAFRTAMPRDGIPLPIVNYLAMQEFEEPTEPTGSKQKSDEDDNAEEEAADQQMADDGAMSDDGDADEEALRAAAGEPADDEASVQENAEADRANDLYWRMAGWS